MMKKSCFFIFLLVIQITGNAQGLLVRNPAKGFTIWMPAPSFEQALLLGNGEMGAMVFGHPHNETIIVNHCALYLPTTYPFKPIDQAGRLTEIRELLLRGKGTEAALIPVEQSKQEGYPGQIWNDPYIPAFDLLIQTQTDNIDQYQRSLDFETGEALISWKQNGTLIERRQFISRTDSLLVIQIKASKPVSVTFELKQRPVNWDQWNYINENIKYTRIATDSNQLYYSCEFVRQWQPNIIGYNGVGLLKATDGKISRKGNALHIEKATQILFFVKVKPYYFGGYSNKEALASTVKSIPGDYQQLLASHVSIHKELFNRVQLNLNGTAADYLMDGEVMMQQAKERFSPAFVEKQFYAARYNILSATGKNLPNLQGIWGNSWTPPWASDYTHNGNLPTAISSFLSSDMPELMNSFFDYHDARLPYYRDNAQKLYNCRGIIVSSHTSSHGWNVHFDKTWCMTFWIGGAAWASHFYYDYWLYTQDKQFLAERAYPFMKEAALFYEDFLTEGSDGKWVFNPSYSPENNPANNPSQAVVNATMDVALAKELFRNLLSAGIVLNEKKEQMQKWSQILAKMPAYQTDSTGAFREWLWPGYQENHYHRHISQLYGMYDLIDPEIAQDPELWKGIQKTLEERMKVRRNDQGGIMVFGLVQMAWVAANLGDAAMTEEIIHWLSAQYWSNSLATYHDPNGLFNMDLSGGFQTAIIKTLVYSEPGFIHILPAKPASWETGSISGILARNQVSVNQLSWTPEKVILKLQSPIGQKIKLKGPSKSASVWVNNKTKTFEEKNKTVEVTLKASEELKIEINLNN
ncbi:MAG TPA: alpha-L-fucosidase [Marinilabiliales bacterium]|nr:alpha-L-fucosidase [Marinilabiliales bacterium]HAZ03893.1 alpha-L-fucosidase [Marinilabiliales bacterium]HBX84312.1 alpha-L-fucosidase [Marinilabiliales bacterium]